METKEKGLILNSSIKLQVDGYVDIHPIELWNVEQDQNPLYDESCTRYFIMFMRFTLTWVSKI